jgi:hypothetical protein
MTEISHEQFQIFKCKLTEEVKEYLELDEQISALNKAVKARKKRRKELSNNILDNMKNIDIHHMNVKNGKLSYNVTNTVEPLNKKSLVSGLQKYFNEDERKALDVAKLILENREKKEKISLKYIRAKKSLDLL